MINSKRKGKIGELELSSILNSYGFSTRRSQQYCGSNGDGDVIGLDGVHIECKRTKSGHGKTYEWLNQSKNDSREDISVVMHRADRKDWLVTLSLDDFMKLYINYRKGAV